jgi:Kef-type K+ transport system membrane component KefB
MVDSELSRLLLSVVLLLSLALGMGHLFNIFRLPRVIGEICAGIFLGPSLVGLFAPEIYTWIFNGFADQRKLLSVFYWFGLILLMFSAGFELPEKTDKNDRVLLLSLFLGGISLPFLSGLLLAHSIPNKMASNDISFSLVIALASAVTSIPVLSRIFIDLNMIASRFAKMVLTVAALQDLVLWIGLSVALAIQAGSGQKSVSISDHIEIIMGTIIFIFFTIYIVPFILRISDNIITNKTNQSPFQSPLIGYTLLLCFVLVTVATIFKVNVVFAALLAGVVIGRFSGLRMLAVKQNIKNFSIWFFVPLYFSLVGLQINIPHSLNLALLLQILLLTSFVKIASVTLFAKLSLTSWAGCIDYGVAMNARGGPGIVLASLAYTAKIIDEELFLVMVLVSIITSLFAGIWLRKRSQIIVG